MYVCGLGDVVALFLEERKADTLLRLRGARSRFSRGGCFPLLKIDINFSDSRGKGQSRFQRGIPFFVNLFE